VRRKRAGSNAEVLVLTVPDSSAFERCTPLGTVPDPCRIILWACDHSSRFTRRVSSSKQIGLFSPVVLSAPVHAGGQLSLAGTRAFRHSSRGSISIHTRDPHYVQIPADSRIVTCSLLQSASRNLEIYWVDAEGRRRDAHRRSHRRSLLSIPPIGRLTTAMPSASSPPRKKAGLKKIDVLVTTHFHGDHIGAIAALAKLIPIGMYMDHGPSVELNRPNVAALYKLYEEQTAGKRRILKPGDRIPMKGVEIEVVMSAANAITKPLKGAGAKERHLCGLQGTRS